MRGQSDWACSDQAACGWVLEATHTIDRWGSPKWTVVHIGSVFMSPDNFVIHSSYDAELLGGEYLLSHHMLAIHFHVLAAFSRRT